ncbi:HNH endonuclease [Streptomyces sp. NPDC048442]|uniref:HNH endonuclease n=1 Tax=Streptomyces sp. NPDC048442 TaxID=3154823 RepID=UPI003430C031
MANPTWTPDELLLACALVVKNGWRELREGDRAVAELSELLRSLPIHDGAAKAPDFRSLGSVSRKTTDLATNHPAYPRKPTRCGKGDKAIIQAFIDDEAGMLQAAQALEEGIASGELFLIPAQPEETDEDGISAVEGKLLTRWAISRERDPKLRRSKIAQARKRNQPLQCEVCTFDFGQTYGDVGKDYIEVHHRLPLHVSGLRKTKLDDLAFLCANCHRMCHRHYEGTRWRTPEDVRAARKAHTGADGTS